MKKTLSLLRADSLLDVFAAMLKSVGGRADWLIESAEEVSERIEERWRTRANREEKYPIEPVYAWPLADDSYGVDGHGSIRRQTPKRDKSMSGRQWRKRLRAERMAANPSFGKHPAQAVCGA
jgi:hypothetical protein